jgi:superfamily II DNA or RNA helicase
MAEFPSFHHVRFSMVQAHTATIGLMIEASWVVLDECHHLYGTPLWSKTIAGARFKQTLALTATPERGDGAALGNLADAIVVAAQPRQLIADGFLVPCDVIAPAGFTRQMSEHPVTAWRKYADGKKAIVFCRDVKHAQQVADEFRDAGVPAGCVDGRMSEELRAERLAAHKRGELLVLTNVHVLTEGYDDPSVECCILCAGCSTAGAFIQRVGRIVRPYPGKTRATVIDLRGSVYLWGLPDEDRRYSLEGKAIVSGGDVTEAIRQCKVCQRVFRAVEFQDATCPACGARSKGKPDPRVRRETMQKVLATHTVEDKRRKFGELIAVARARGYSHKWSIVQFKLRYGHWPGKDMR